MTTAEWRWSRCREREGGEGDASANYTFLYGIMSGEAVAADDMSGN